MIKVNPFKVRLENGCHVYLEVTELGNRYLTDEVGCGALVWDTAIVSRKAMLAALAMEMLGEGDPLKSMPEDLTEEQLRAECLYYCLLINQLVSDNTRLMEGMLPGHVIEKYAADTKSMVRGCGRKPVPGIRLFECEECGHKWQERSRDCLSPSGEHCEKCQDFTAPVSNEPHPEWETDKAGNLV